VRLSAHQISVIVAIFAAIVGGGGSGAVQWSELSFLLEYFSRRKKFYIIIASRHSCLSLEQQIRINFIFHFFPHILFCEVKFVRREREREEKLLIFELKSHFLRINFALFIPPPLGTFHSCSWQC
jgi:hypothetical protein